MVTDPRPSYSLPCRSITQVVSDGVVEALVELAARGAPDREPAVVTERVLERVAWALRNLAKDKITRPKVAAAGGAEQLVALAARASRELMKSVLLTAAAARPAAGG